MIASYVYIITPEGETSPCKVGISKDPYARVASLQTGSPVLLQVAEVYGFESHDEAAEMEKRFHGSYEPSRMHGEWFDVPFTEANWWLFMNAVAPDLDEAGL